MSAAEELINPERVSAVPKAPLLNRFLDYVSSVRLGVIVLCILVVLSMIGMLIMQQDVEGFDAYYVSLTPAEKLVFGHLGLFDIYHSWYYLAMLLFLSLNIVLASIDRLPSAWSYIVKPKLDATRGWLLNRRRHFEMKADVGDGASIANAVAAVFKKQGLSTTVTEKGNAFFVFGQSGKWNRIGAYIVHVALLTLFLGYFVALQTGFNAVLRLAPGEKTNHIEMQTFDLDKKLDFDVTIPFTIECTDIQQKLINPEGDIDISNTMDWRTEVKINDPGYGTNTYEISLNKPLSYRGYRFFQSQAIAMGSARNITLSLTPANGGDEIKLQVPRGGETTLADGTRVSFDDFQPDFAMGQDGQPTSRSSEYNNPAAILTVAPPSGPKTRVIAFTPDFADKAPVAGAPKAGFKWRLVDFEKSPLAHVLSIKYDPYGASFIAWYIGGFGLVGALGFVFFISHRRVWARIEPTENGGHDIVIAGESNRNHASFDDRFDRIMTALRGPEDSSNGRSIET